MRRMSDDRGAVAVLVALLVPVVLLGMGALVLDFGQLYAEKRQLQNGADAAALAVARDYAQAPPADQTCIAGARIGTAQSYADENANDAAGSNIAFIECPEANQLRIGTSTRSSDGGFLTPILRQVLGEGNITVAAVAAANWGPPSSLTGGLPITISQCEFDFYTDGGTDLGPQPPYTTPYPEDQAIKFHDTDAEETGSGCPSSSSGADLPGGFGWLNPDAEPEGSCVAKTDADGYSEDKPGTSVPGTDCRDKLQELLGEAVPLPIYSETNGLNGSNGEYLIEGYAAFVLTGYSFPGEREPSLHSGTHYCVSSETCLYGFFTSLPTASGGTVGTGPSMGVTVFGMTE